MEFIIVVLLGLIVWNVKIGMEMVVKELRRIGDKLEDKNST